MENLHMIIEIIITTLITVLLVFIAALVLGLQIRSIKKTLTTEENAISNLANKSQERMDSINTYVKSSIESNQLQLNNLNAYTSNTRQQVNDINNAINNLNRSLSTTQNQMNSMNSIIKTQIDKLNNDESDILAGKINFSKLKVGPAVISQEEKSLNIGNISTLNLPKDSCIQIGNGMTICGTAKDAFNANNLLKINGDLNISGSLNNISPYQMQSAINNSYNALTTANLALSKVTALQEMRK